MANQRKFKWAVNFCLKHGVTFKKYPSPVQLLKAFVHALKKSGKMPQGVTVYNNASKKDAPELLEYLCDALPAEYRVNGNGGMFKKHKEHEREKENIPVKSRSRKKVKPRRTSTEPSPALNKLGATFIKSKEFLATKEWKRLRIDAIEKYGNCCMICGRKPPEITINVDHIVPRAVDWTLALTLDNLQILCSDCNEGKGNRYTTDYRPT